MSLLHQIRPAGKPATKQRAVNSPANRKQREITPPANMIEAHDHLMAAASLQRRILAAGVTVDDLEALACGAAKIVHKTDRKAYMRELMRKRRAKEKA